MNFQDFKNKYQKKEPREYPHKVTPQPILSVLVQTFKHKGYIRDCLDGILQQRTSLPFEIILGEDCSNDGTREICIEYAEKNPEKIRLFLHQPENKIEILGIPSGNFNALYNFFSAKGEFIAFCEGDDVWIDSSKLQKQIDSLARNRNYALVYHPFREIDATGKSLHKGSRLQQPQIDIGKEDLQRLNLHPLLSTVCFRNYFSDAIPKEIAEVINVDSFLLSMLGKYGEAGFLPTITPSYYRRHTGGIWSNKDKLIKYRSKILTYRKLRDFYFRVGEINIGKYYARKSKSIQKMLIFYIFKRINIFSGCIREKKFKD